VWFILTVPFKSLCALIKITTDF
jgi:hypothetical protein